MTAGTADSNKVVALTSALLSGSVSAQSGSIRSPSVSSNPTSGLENRTCAVLDALAALCVCEPKSEVISIACRSKEPNVELFIASNNGPPPDSTRKHLKSIWDSLCDISDRKHSGKKLDTNPLTESPQFKITRSLADTSLHKLFMDIYKHSFHVAEKRYAKYWPIVEEFSEQYRGLIEYEKSIVSHGQNVAEWKYKETFKQYQILTGAFASMHKVLLKFRKKDWVPNAIEIKFLIEIWWFIYDIGAEVVKNPLACDTWTDTVKSFGSSNKPCRLQRAIEKLCTIHSQVGTLIRFAYSARMRPMLSECNVIITPVELVTPTNKRPMPSTENEWRQVLQDIFKRKELEFEGSPEEVRANEKRIFRSALAQKRPVEHCECLLVAYLLLDDSGSLISYIGTSKLSCKPCFLWLQAVKEVTGCQFKTKGCHDKWYPGWSTPELSDHRFKSEIEKSFLEKVEFELCEGLKASKVAKDRAQSDSSNCSEGGKAILDLEDRTEYERMFMAEVMSLYK